MSNLRGKSYENAKKLLVIRAGMGVFLVQKDMVFEKKGSVMTEGQIKLLQMLLRENQKLGAQLDVALEALNKYATSMHPVDIANKALIDIVKIGL